MNARFLILLFFVLPFNGQAESNESAQLSAAQTAIIDSAIREAGKDLQQNGQLSPEAAERLYDLAIALEQARHVASVMPLINQIFTILPYALVSFLAVLLALLFHATKTALCFNAVAFGSLYLISAPLFQIFSLTGLSLSVLILLIHLYRSKKGSFRAA